MRHLLGIEQLDRVAIERICDRAAAFAEVSGREIKKVPALRGRTVLNLFYEASTRTRSSFELAAKRLSADVVNFAASGSSVEKGESLKDTVLTLSAHKPDAIVIRTPWAGAAQLVTGWTSAAIINAADSKPCGESIPTAEGVWLNTLTRSATSRSWKSSGEPATTSGTTTSRPPCSSAPKVSHTEKSKANE